MLCMGRASISVPICLADGHSADPGALSLPGDLRVSPGCLTLSGSRCQCRPICGRLYPVASGLVLGSLCTYLSYSHLLCPALQLTVGDEQTPTFSICLYHFRTRVTLPDHPGHPVVSPYPVGAGGEAETWATQWFHPTQWVLEGRLRLGPPSGFTLPNGCWRGG